MRNDRIPDRLFAFEVEEEGEEEESTEAEENYDPIGVFISLAKNDAIN